ncbi:MAG: hypothetical protein P9L92_16785 [Candidatus Electryonea clarkiae]|nr:hypothetical protein [Candidatus Electryonea clarkiae]MDP8287932.1 hypothetical protein [Candidatus Electryonea clarkiae]
MKKSPKACEDLHRDVEKGLEKGNTEITVGQKNEATHSIRAG